MRVAILVKKRSIDLPPAFRLPVTDETVAR
jgi:hypothetical protein